MSNNDENGTLREERDDLRKRLEGIKRIPRYGTKWSVRDFHDGSSEVFSELAPDPEGGWVRWTDIAEIVGENGKS